MDAMSDLIVQKFGGASLRSLDDIPNITRYIIPAIESGKKIVIVVSALKKETDSLIEQVNHINNQTQIYNNLSTIQSDNICTNNYSINTENLKLKDMVISSGEQLTSGLLAIALNNIGIPTTSLLGWQIPIYTDNNYGNSKIQSIKIDKIFSLLKVFKIVVVAGFQGIYKSENRITTLGRGGSDITAVALTIALKAKSCEIYTDVSGIYNADPINTKNAKKMSKISYTMMLSMAHSGAKVLHFKAVHLAQQYNLDLKILSSFNELDMEGTTVTNIKNIIDDAESSNIKNSHFLFDQNNQNIKMAVVSKEMHLINIATKNSSQIDIICGLHNTLNDSIILLHSTNNVHYIGLKTEDFEIFNNLYKNYKNNCIYTILEHKIFIVTIMSDYQLSVLPFLKKKFDEHNISIKNFYFLDDKIRIVVTGRLEYIHNTISIILDKKNSIIENV